VVKYLPLVFLSGCAFFDNTFIAENKPAKLVEVRVVDQAMMREICKTNDYTLGCAVFTKTRCIIYTEKETTYETFGHELRHCFYGKFHD
jgi:hypothetical protein